MTLPSSLQTLKFGSRFNQSLASVKLPEALQEISFGYYYNMSIKGVRWPSKLHTLTFGNDFNQPLETLPASLKTLVLGAHFVQSLEEVAPFPSNLRTLNLGGFQGNISKVKLPDGLQSLTLSNCICSEAGFCISKSMVFFVVVVAVVVVVVVVVVEVEGNRSHGHVT